MLSCAYVVQIIEAAKKRGAEKAKLTKSMIVLDVKPWDDTTGEPLCRTSTLLHIVCHTSTLLDIDE